MHCHGVQAQDLQHDSGRPAVTFWPQAHVKCPFYCACSSTHSDLHQQKKSTAILAKILATLAGHLLLMSLLQAITDSGRGDSAVETAKTFLPVGCLSLGQRHCELSNSTTQAEDITIATFAYKY